MKPTRNHTFCLSCHRPKMLFETKEKADAFIRFNAEEILSESGKAPVRSYYCPLCCGYHVTSNPSAEKGEEMNSRDEAMIRSLDKAAIGRSDSQEMAKLYTEPIAASIEHAKTLMARLRMDEARELLDAAICEIRIGLFDKATWRKGPELLRRAELCKECIVRYEGIIAAPEKVQEFRNTTPVEWDQVLLHIMVGNHVRMERLSGRLDEIESTIEGGAAIEDVQESIDAVRDELKEWKNYGIQASKSAYNQRLQGLENRARYGDEKAQAERRRRKQIIFAIDTIQKAASIKESGNPSLYGYYLDLAAERLAEVEPCPEKDQVSAVIARLMEAEGT